MAARTSVIIEQKSLDDSVREGYSQIGKSFVDDIINKISKSEERSMIRQAMADFLGVYKAVKSSLKEEGICIEINYFEREALLDSYSTNIAASEALNFLSSKGVSKRISKTGEIKTLFNRGLNSSLDFMKYEKNPSLRERLVTGDLLASYLEAANNLNPKMIPGLTVNYFEWVMLQSVKTKDSIINHGIFDEGIKKYKVILPSKNEYAGFRNNGFRNPGEKTKVQCGSISRNRMAAANKDEPMPYPFLVRDIPSITFEDVGGLDEHKELIYEAIKLPIEKKEEFREKGVEAPKGLIFYGEKGCGKTFIAKAISNELRLPFFQANGSEFRQKYLGDGPKTVRQLFADARAIAPSLIFIDEVDACLLDVGTDEGKYSRDIVNQMLAEIDGFEALDSVKVIVGTNHYAAIDSRFLDRFPLRYHLEFRLPDAGTRHNALKVMTRKMKIGKVDLMSMAALTEGANFRALYFICNGAGLYSIKDRSSYIEQRHFDMSLLDYSKNPQRYNG